MTTAAKAQTLVGLYDAPEILRVVNVWDVVSARAVAALPETKAIATAGHGIAASFGYDDGATPREIMIDMVGRIAAAVAVPVSADLDDGYGDAGETTRLAIGVGVVGANIEDRLKPLDESVAAVAAIVKAAEALKKNGAKSVVVAATHPIFSDPASEILASEHIDRVVVTDTLPLRDDQRFEIDGADEARRFLLEHGLAEERADLAWAGIALHTTPEIPLHMATELALVTRR